MSIAGRRVVAVLCAAAATLGLGWLSRLPYVSESGNQGIVRLAWRARGARVEVCRHRTPEELAALPAHMREDDVCESRVLPYRLTVAVDGHPAMDDTVHAAGARGDRPLYVLRDLRLAAGPHRMSIEFTRLGTTTEAFEAEEKAEGHARHGEAPPTPARMVLDTVLVLRERAIVLVTYEMDEQRLVIRRSD